MKRFFDFFAAALGLLILSPILLIIAFLILIFLGRPIIFSQKRLGLNNKNFYLLKFRSMKNDPSGTMSDHNRITRLGTFLRKASLDELPSLINILKGEMSLVGPRPLPSNYFDYYTERELNRHSVRPGLTGLAQVSGRNNLTWEERFAKDLEYVSSQTLYLDIKILFRTAIKVLKRSDVVVVTGGNQKLCDMRERRQDE